MVGIPPWLALTSTGATVAQLMVAPVPSVIVHEMVPVGSGSVTAPPATRAVTIALPPKSG